MVPKVEEFKNHVVGILKTLKFEFRQKASDLAIPIYRKDNVIARLRPISQELENDKFYVKLLAEWRTANEQAYPTVFKVTLDGTEKWIREQLIEREDRILFMILNLDNQPIGHLGLSNFDFSKRAAEIDNVIRGVNGILSGIMTLSLNTLEEWAFTTLDLEKLFLRVFYENTRAITLYERCGFRGIKKIPLHKAVYENVTKYEEIEEGSNLSIDRYFYLMELESKK